MPLSRIVVLAWLAFVAPIHAATEPEPTPKRFQLQINGLKPALESAVLSGLTLQQYRDRSVSDAQLRRLLSLGEAEIRATLEAWGYYDGKVSSHMEDAPEGRYRAWFDVAPGTPILVKSREVSVSGDAAQVPAVASALKAFVPKLGERFDHTQYESSKEAIVTALTDHGYLAARLITHRVEVTTATHSARIELKWNSGPRYTFGPTTFTGGQFSEEFLQQFLPWKQGEVYSSADVLDLQRRLVGADYFGTVTVTPYLEKAVDLAVPVTVDLTAAKRNIYSAELYASTDRGVGVELGAQRRWLNTKGHKGRADLNIAQRLQAIELSYRIPLPGAKQRVLGFAGTYRDETTESSISQTEKLVANVSRKWNEYTFVYGVQLLAGDFEIGSERGNSTLLFLESAFSRSKADQPTFARRGFSYTVAARLAPLGTVSDTRFVSATAEAKWLRALGTDMRLILRGEVGKMNVDDFDQLPPELRFFSGGDRSIRGFGYEEIGSRNEAGDVIGGDNLVEANVEVERYWGKVGGALFVDGGDSFLGDDFRLHVGVGAGVRWRSPVGVLRLDVAYPVKSIDSDSWQIHFNIGPDF